MKRVIVICTFVVVLILFSGCSGEQNVNYKEGVYPYKDWSETLLTYTGEAIPNKESALKVATAVFESLQLVGQITPPEMAEDLPPEKLQRFIPQEVFYDEVDHVWIVCFWEPFRKNWDGSFVVGPCCSIALQKENGAVLRIWFDE